MTDREHNNAILNEFAGWKPGRKCIPTRWKADGIACAEHDERGHHDIPPIDFYAPENFDKLDVLIDKFVAGPPIDFYAPENFDKLDVLIDKFVAGPGNQVSVFTFYKLGVGVVHAAHAGRHNCEHRNKQTALADALAAALKERK